MLIHTKKIKEIYEDIQRKLFYIIPEKWENLYLYSSVQEMPGEFQTGELFFYYIPKGIFRKNPVNVYEIPSKFNLDENEYVKLVKILYEKIKDLREEFKEANPGEIWSNLTISIENLRFKVEYKYDDLNNSEFSSYERHIIWRYHYLGVGLEQLNKEERKILKRYLSGSKSLVRQEEYITGIYIRDIRNIVDYDTEKNDIEEKEYEPQLPKKIKNQILLSEEEITKMRVK